MTLKVYRGEKFEFTHENRAFDELYEKLEREWHDADELSLLAGNFSCNGALIDALFIKRDSITVLDFKDYGGKVIYSENGNWKADDVDVRGGEQINPYRQLTKNKLSVLNYLKESLPTISRDNNLGHISAVVIFQKPIEFDANEIKAPINRWFSISDMDNAVKSLSQIASPEINLTNLDIVSIIKSLNIPEYELPGRKAYKDTINIEKKKRQRGEVPRGNSCSPRIQKEIIRPGQKRIVLEAGLNPEGASMKEVSVTLGGSSVNNVRHHVQQIGGKGYGFKIEGDRYWIIE